MAPSFPLPRGRGWRFALMTSLAVLLPVAAFGHLCNDVFVQAKDNLAVKVDVRDGQLRIGQTASFRVYLLNTMDRQLNSIGLRIESQAFTAQVKPGPDWQGYPAINAVSKGGRKVHFVVTLTRKPGLADGKYSIGLKLTEGGKRSTKVYKTLDMEKAAGILELPARANPIAIDGAQDKAEWDAGALCAAFYERQKKDNYTYNVSSEVQTRARFLQDAENLYCSLSLARPAGREAGADQCVLYVAKDCESIPVKVTFDAKAGTVTGAAGAEFKFSADRTAVEARLPLSALGLAGKKNFYMNLVRTTTTGPRKVVTYWQGNEQCLEQPMVYGNFVVAGIAPATGTDNAPNEPAGNAE